MLLRGNEGKSEIRGGNLVKRDETIGGIVLLLFGLVTVIFSLRMPIGIFRMAGTGLFPLCHGVQNFQDFYCKKQYLEE